MTRPLPQAEDLRGAVRLTTDAVAGLVDVVEAMHARIARTAWPTLWAGAASAERTRGLTGRVYAAVRGVTRGVGGTADAVLRRLPPTRIVADRQRAVQPRREAAVAALNGVLGDHLAATSNPLAIAMTFRRAGRPLPLEPHALRAQLVDVTPRVAVLLHGLCMNDLQWHRAGHDHGAALARDLGYTPVYLHYNTGLGVAANGRLLAELMERLHDAWPVPLERMAMIGHSMGGLVARSALHHAGISRRFPMRWPARVDDLVCLGSPHLGAPLERAGHGVDRLLGMLPYASPLARIGRLRSAGITDLRHGRIVEPAAGGPGVDRIVTIPLPPWIRCHALAANLGEQDGNLKGRLLGDGLVPVASALGRHARRERCLDFPPQRRAVVHGTGHLDLLSSAEVYGWLRRWLG